jgi:hypothetical protein
MSRGTTFYRAKKPQMNERLAVCCKKGGMVSYMTDFAGHEWSASKADAQVFRSKQLAQLSAHSIESVTGYELEVVDLKGSS